MNVLRQIITLTYNDVTINFITNLVIDIYFHKQNDP